VNPPNGLGSPDPRELDQQAVPGGLDDPPAMFRDLGINQLSP
jgi:hypothetical protein